MEIEHINEDTIRVRINNTDLEARGYTFLDLLGNQQQIEEFFYSILEEVDLDDEFKDSEAVTFQVMPNPNGLELLISKNADVHDNIASNVDFENFDNALLESVDSEADELIEEDDGESEEIAWEDEEKEIVIEFNRFEQIVQLAQTVPVINGFSSLYQYKEKYYLAFHLIRDEYSLRRLEEKIAILLEYGGKSRLTNDVLSEHGELLIDDEALETIYHYFK